MDFSSKLLENAVYEISQLPSIGKRTALRLALHLLKQPEEQTLQLAEALLALRTHIQYCQNCHNLSDAELCEICANPVRNTGVICVVEDFRDVMAIENTHQFLDNTTCWEEKYLLLMVFRRQTCISLHL